MSEFSKKNLFSKEIKSEARTLGFDGVGIAKADQLTEEALHLREWLDRGYHGTMDWMARNFDKRIDPDKVLPGAKSVVAVAMNYYTGHIHEEKIGRASCRERV